LPATTTSYAVQHCPIGRTRPRAPTSPRGTSSTKRSSRPCHTARPRDKTPPGSPTQRAAGHQLAHSAFARNHPPLSARSRPPAGPSRFEHAPKQPQPRAARRVHLARHNLPKQPRTEQQLPRRATLDSTLSIASALLRSTYREPKPGMLAPHNPARALAPTRAFQSPNPRHPVGPATTLAHGTTARLSRSTLSASITRCCLHAGVRD
jgi:hypothetical protein